MADEASTDFRERIVEQREIFSGNTVSVLGVKVEVAPNDIEEFEVVVKGGDSVGIIGLDEDNSVHFIEEYYPAANRRLMSLAKGTIENNESAEAAASRELSEEMGIRGRLVKLATFHLSPGYLRQVTEVFVATRLEPASAEGDERTFIRSVKVSLNQAVDMVLDGQITEARLVATILLLDAKARRSQAESK